MARKSKSGSNKSAAIREYKAANPSAGPKDIADDLEKSGVSVTAQFVSTVLSNAKRKGGKIGKRGRKPGGAVAPPVGDLQQLIHVKKFVDKLGGIEKAKAAVDVLARLMG